MSHKENDVIISITGETILIVHSLIDPFEAILTIVDYRGLFYSDDITRGLDHLALRYKNIRDLL